MSILNLSSLRKIFNTSSKKGSGKKSISEKMNRKLALDSLEDRVLLSVTPNTVSEILVNTEYSANQTTYTNGNALAIDDDGDYVVTWTRGENIYQETYHPTTEHGNVGWYNQEGELILYTDRNYIDGFYTDDLGETHEVALEIYKDPYALSNPVTVYVDPDGNKGWYDDRGVFHPFTAENYKLRQYTVYPYKVSDDYVREIPVVYQFGDDANYKVAWGMFYETDQYIDGRQIVETVRLTKKNEIVERQLVDYNVYARYFTDEVQRLTFDTTNLAENDMLYRAEIQVGEWYEQKITFSRSYGSLLPLEGYCEISYIFPTSDGETSPFSEKDVFYFSEDKNAIDNAKSIQEALTHIFGQGNVRVTAETLLSYKVEFKFDEMGEQTDLVDYQTPLLVNFISEPANFNAEAQTSNISGEWYNQTISITGDETPLSGYCEVFYRYPSKTGTTARDSRKQAFYFSDELSEEENANSILKALNNIFGEGNVRVTAGDLHTYNVEFRISNKEKQYTARDYQKPLQLAPITGSGDFGTAVDLVNIPNTYEFFFEYEKSYNKDGSWSGEYKKDENGHYIVDVSATAEQIILSFQYGKNCTTRKISPAIETDHPTSGVETGMYRYYTTKVVPVYGLKDDNTLIGFDITFVDDSGKQNIQEIRVNNVYTVSEIYFADKYADEIIEHQEWLVEIQESDQVGKVLTLKESSEEFRVNPTTDDEFNRKAKWYLNTDQYESAVAMDDNGDFAVSWTSSMLQTRNPASYTDIRAKLFSAAMINTYDAEMEEYVANPDSKGKAVKDVTDAITINTEYTNPQQSSCIAMDDAGNIFVVWAETAQDLSFENGIYLSCLDWKGNKIDLKYLGITEGLTADGLAVRVDTEPAGHAVMPQVAVTPDGKTVGVSWNWVDPEHKELSEIRLSVYTFETDENNKTTFQKRTADVLIDSAGLQKGDRAGMDTYHMPTDIEYSYDNRTSIQFNKSGQLGLAWTAVGTDEMGFDTVDTYFVQYEVTNGTLNQVRGIYRINSADMNPGRTTWSWYHDNPTVAMDADGDFLVGYDGAGPDVSDGVTFDATIIQLLQEKINELNNSDLLPYINWNYMIKLNDLTHDGTVSVDTAIQLICAHALRGQFSDPNGDPDEWFPSYDENGNPAEGDEYREGCTKEQYSRLYAILHSVLNLTKGEANGVLYSSFDANPISLSSAPGTVASLPTILSSDAVVNTTRDGEDAKYYVKLERTRFFSKIDNISRRLYGLTYATKYVTDDDGNYVLENGQMVDKGAVNWDEYCTYSGYETLYNNVSITLNINVGDSDNLYIDPDTHDSEYGKLETNIDGNTFPIRTTKLLHVNLSECYVRGSNGVYFDSETFLGLIEKAIEDALPNMWPNNGDYDSHTPYKGTVRVRPVSTDDDHDVEEGRWLDETVYDISDVLLYGDTYDTFSADKLAFEVQFQGVLHDANVQLSVSVDSIYRPTILVDLNHCTGKYARFTIYNGTKTQDKATLIKDVVVDFTGCTTLMDKYNEFMRELRLAGFINYTMTVEDMVCDTYDSPYYEYGETYPVLVIKCADDLNAGELHFSLNFSNPDADQNTQNPIPRYPDWVGNTLVGCVIIDDSWVGPNKDNWDDHGPEAVKSMIAYSQGKSGTAQAFSNVGMTPEGDFAYVWTQYNTKASNHTGSESIYTRTYNEEYDTYGPRISDVYYSNSIRPQKIEHGGTIEDFSSSTETRALIVTFTEDMMDYLKITSKVDPRTMDAYTVHSVTNTDNWVLVKDGLTINNAIKEIYFGMNASADPYIQNMGTIAPLRENKWEAVLILNDEIDLGTGNYQLQISKVITDANGQPLNADGINTEGANTTIGFDILTGAKEVIDETPETIYGGDQQLVDLDKVTDIWSPTALASDPEGDSVLVWASDEEGKEGIYAKIRYLKWDEELNDNREDCSLDEDSLVIQVTDDSTAFSASVDMSGDGNFVVTWTADANDDDKEKGTYVYAKVFDLNGNVITDTFIVSQPNKESKWSQVAVSESGDFVITWQTFDKTTGWDIYAQRFDQEGKILGSVNEVQLLNFTRDFSGSFQLTVVDPDNYEEFQTGMIEFQKTFTTYRDIQKALDDLEIPGLKFIVNAKSRTQIAITIVCDNTITNPNVDLMEVIPSSDSKGSVSVMGSIDGSRSPFMVNESTKGHQTYAAIDMDYKGNFVVTWTSEGENAADDFMDTDIFVRQFSSSQDLGLINGTIKSDNNLQATEKITWVDGEEEPLSTLSGVAMLTVSEMQTGEALWSGSGVLLSDGNCTYVMTAQHCVNSYGYVVNDNATAIVEFYNTAGTKVVGQVEEVYLYPGYATHPLLGGVSIGDIALLKLTQSFADTVTGYAFNREVGAELGQVYTRFGFGTYGTGTTGSINDVDGTMHTGQNRWEYIDDYGFLYFDFDDGTPENNNLAEFLSQNLGVAVESDLGIGATETNSCGGDSGGPCFITVNGKPVVAGICEGGATQYCRYGDVSWDTQVSYYADWIDSIIGIKDGAVSGEMRVNTTTEGTQKWPDVALDADGDFVVTWTSSVSEFSTETDIYARRFNKDGSAVTDTDFKVNSYTERQQQLSKVAIDADGDFVIAWESFREYNDGMSVGDANNYGIYMQRYASTEKATDYASLYGANGENGAEMRVNTIMYGDQRIPNVAMTATGDIFFIWQSNETLVGDENGSVNIYSRAIYKSDDDAGPVVVRIAGEFTPTVVGVEGELIDSDRKPILDEEGNPINVNLLVEDGTVCLQNSDYYFIDRYGYLVNEAIDVMKNGCITGTDVEIDEVELKDGKLYLWKETESGIIEYYDLEGNRFEDADHNPIKQEAAELVRNGKLVDSHGQPTDIDVTVIVQEGKVFIITETARKYYNADGTESASPTVVDRLVDEEGYLLGKDGKQVYWGDKRVWVNQCWVTGGEVFLKNAEGYYLTREGKTSAKKVAAETYASDGKLIIDGVVSDISAMVRCKNGEIYFEYVVKEMLDRDGNVKDRIGIESLVNISGLGNSTTLYGKITNGLYITFDEQLWGQKNGKIGEDGSPIKERDLRSILNKNNIVIRRDGMVVTSEIVDRIILANDELGIGFDNVDESYVGSKEHHSEKDIYKIIFKDGVYLPSGSYQITIQDNVEDRFGNQLDGNSDGTPGGNYVLGFTVVADLDDEGNLNAPIGDSDKDCDDQVSALSIAPQTDPAVAMNKWGDYVVVWVSEVQIPVKNTDDDNNNNNNNGDENEEDQPLGPTVTQSVIMGQRYLRDGSKVGEQFCISDYTTTITRDGVSNTKTMHLTGVQFDPAVAMDDEGNFAVTWTVKGRDLNEDARVDINELSEYDVFVRTYNTYGEATSIPFLVDDASTKFRKSNMTGFNKLPDYAIPGIQKESDIAYSRADNTFVVTWTVDNSKDSGAGTYYWDNDKNGIYMARFKVGDPDENSDDSTTYLPIYRQETPQLVNDISTHSQITSSVTVDGEEGVVVAWASDLGTGSEMDIYLKKFEVTDSSDSGNYISGYSMFTEGDFKNQILVNEGNVDRRQETPDVAMNDEGDIVIAWSSKEKNGDYDIMFRTYDHKSDGSGTWTNVQKANSFTTFDQKSPTVSITRNVLTKSRKEPNTSFGIAWTSFGQEEQSKKSLGVYLISYENISEIDPETNTILGGENIRTKDRKEALMNVYKPQDEKNPDIAMSCYGDVIVVWDGPSLAGVDDPLNNISDLKALLAAYYQGSAANTDEYDDMTDEEILNLFNDTFGTSIYKSFWTSPNAHANVTQMLTDDDYVPLEVTTVAADPIFGSQPTVEQSGPRVSVDTGKTTIYTEKNTSSNVVITLGDTQPSVTIDGKALDLAGNDSFIFNGYLSGNSTVNVTVQGAGNEEVSIDNGIITITSGVYSFVLKNINTVAFNSQDVSLNVNVSRGDTFILEGNTARLAGFTIIGCTEVNAIGNSSCVAKLTGTEDDEEFQVKANKVTMSGGVTASVKGFGKVTLNGNDQDEILFTNLGDFTVNGSVITVNGLEASNFANVQVLSTGIANVTTSGAAMVNVADKTLTIAGNGFTQTYTGMSTLNLTGAANASAEVTVNSSVNVADGTLHAAAYSVNAFGQVVVKNATHVTLTGTEGNDTLTIDTVGATFNSASQAVTFSTFNTLTLNDSEGNDAVSVLTDASSVLIQNGIARIGGNSIVLNGVATLAVTCTNANAQANISGSVGDDAFTLSEEMVSAVIENATYTVSGASRIIINGNGGNDSLIADDTAGNDTFTLTPTSLSANNYSWIVNNVDNIKLYQSNGGNDSLTVEGTNGFTDNAVVSPRFASVTNASKASVSAYGFSNLQVKNVEYVSMYDSEGDDVMTINANGQVTLESAGSFFNQVSGFKHLSLFSCSEGDDTLDAAAEIQMIDDIFSAQDGSWSVDLKGFKF